MKIPTIRITLAAIALSAVATVSAEEPADPVTAALSGETRVVLIKEMQAIAAAMGRIHTAMVTGDHATVQKEAGNIHDSFVLNQELSDAQRKEIGTKLPADFIAADRTFHQLSAHLAEAGKQKAPRLERLWFQEMTRACQSCHTDYAGNRFPGLQ